MSTSKKANNYLQTENQDLLWVFAKIKQLTTLNQQISTYLAPEIAGYCQVANIIGTRLVMLAANGSIATQLRFQTTDLIRHFQQNAALKHIKSIECKVRPTPTRAQTTRKMKNQQPLSAETAAMVYEMAEGLEDEKLQEVMRRIAQRQ